MKSREEVSLAPCGIVAPRLAKSDFGRIDRFGYPIIALRIVSLFHRVLYTQWIYAVVNVLQGEKRIPFTYHARFGLFFYLSAKNVSLFSFSVHIVVGLKTPTFKAEWVYDRFQSLFFSTSLSFFFALTIDLCMAWKQVPSSIAISCKVMLFTTCM